MALRGLALHGGLGAAAASPGYLASSWPRWPRLQRPDSDPTQARHC